MTTTPQTSGLDPNSMQVLATTPTQKLLWDYNNTQCFFTLTTANNLLQQTSPKLAYSFFGNAGITIIYNPFTYNAYLGKVSGLV